MKARRASAHENLKWMGCGRREAATWGGKCEQEEMEQKEIHEANDDESNEPWKETTCLEGGYTRAHTLQSASGSKMMTHSSDLSVM
jgi:hypothetical protein